MRSFGFPIADILIPLFLGVIALITLPLVFDMHLMQSIAIGMSFDQSG
ncbi:MAG: hypothetical protein U9Q15_02245 [Patescibacteria group bacterium]|nr:hypothetical protein [Patescibacteria group bacterium]